MPSVVSWVCWSVLTSRTQRLYSLMKASSLPSGDGTPPVLLPRLPSVLAGASGADLSGVQVKLWRSQFHFVPFAWKLMDFSSGEKVNVWNGSMEPSYCLPVAVERAAATRCWSKAAERDFFAGSTRMNSLPFAVRTRYQKRSPESQLARPPKLLSTKGSVL